MEHNASDGEGRGIDPQGTTRSDEVDHVCSLLADARRRALLSTLVDHDADAIHVSELATEVARQGDDCPETVAVELHHWHLPKAAEAGVVEYDPRSGDVRYCGHDVVEAVLGG